MRSASRLYRLALLLSGIGVGVLVLAAVGVLRALSVDPGSLEALASACRGMIPALSVGGYLVLGLALLVAASAIRGGRSLARQLRATHRYVLSIRPTGELRVVAGVPCLLTAERAPRAVCAGYLAPRIYLSQGALDALAPSELRAVLAHELHHRERRDPLRLLVARVLADTLFFLPALKPISERYAALLELAADEAAVRALGERATLARALLKFGHPSAPAVAVTGIAPDRVDHLSGNRDAVRWRLSRTSITATAAGGALLLAAVAIVVLLPAPAPISVPLLLAQGCILVMVAAALGLAVTGGRLRPVSGARRR